MTEIHLSYDVPSDVPGAFAGFVEDFAQWWPRPEGTYGVAALERGVGGVMEIPTVRGTEVVGEITDWEPPHFLAWRNRWRHPRGVMTRVSVGFGESEWGTRVHLTHSGWPEAGELEREKFSDWPLILWRYVAHMRDLAPHEDAA